MKISFEPVVYRITKSGRCACGKRTKRTKAFHQTINPFNTRLDGNVKTRADIMLELKAEAVIWERQPIACATCEPC